MTSAARRGRPFPLGRRADVQKGTYGDISIQWKCPQGTFPRQIIIVVIVSIRIISITINTINTNYFLIVFVIRYMMTTLD